MSEYDEFMKMTNEEFIQNAWKKAMEDLITANLHITNLEAENERLRTALEDIEGSPVGEGGDSYEMRAIAVEALREGE